MVYVEEVLFQAQARARPIGCNEVELSVVPISTIPSVYNRIFPVTEWSGNGNLNRNPNRNDSAFTHLYPAPGLYSYNLTLEDTFGCRTNIPGVLNLNTGVTADAGSDITICSNFNFQLGTPGFANQVYDWTPGLSLSDSTAAQPTFVYPNTGQQQDTFFYTLMVHDTANICTTFDYTAVYVNPSLEAEILPADPQICVGDSITLTAVGNLGQGDTYLWSTGDTTQSIRVSPDATNTYSVVTFNSGCSSTPVFTTVEVNEGPEGQIAGDRTICPAATATLTASGGTSYQWNAPGWNQATISFSGFTEDTEVWMIPIDANGCVGDTVFTVIETHPKPIADFTPSTGCQGVVTEFADASTVAGSASITRWNWQLGDGTSANTQTVNHTYDNPGLFAVQLMVQDDNGCRDTLFRDVPVYPQPEADFSYNNVCEEAPTVVTSTASAPLNARIVSYEWDMGDDSPPLTGPSQSYVYDEYGNYDVTLEVATENGCTDAYSRTVFVHPNPVADFEVVSACQDSAVFLSTSSTVEGSLDYIAGHSWNFGDPASGARNLSSNFNPFHAYTEAGFYTILLEVTTDKGCSDATQREVQIFPAPDADFTYDQTCENEFTQFSSISRTDQATPVVRYAWNFDELGGWREGGANTQFRYQNVGPGTYRVGLAIATSEGCIDTAYRTVVINPQPRPNFSVNAPCLGDTSFFQDLSTIAYNEIVRWEWDFDDGRASTYPSPAYRYRTDGQYRVSLTTTTDSGCVNTVVRGATVHPLPEALTIVDDTVCFGKPAFLQALIAPPVQVEWFYNMSDSLPFHRGYTYATPPLPLQETYYVQGVSRPGCRNVKAPVVARIHNGTALDISVSDSSVLLPQAVVQFQTVASAPIEQWVWDFGNGDSSTQADPAQAYSVPGIYRVQLNTTDRYGCKQEAQQLIEVRKEYGLTLPSAFTPNADGINDIYRIGAWQLEAVTFKVFNRWGQVVFEADDPSFEWDGTNQQNGQALPEGVYPFVINALDNTGDAHQKQGTITILR